MRIISHRCLGLDLHKRQITAHLRVHNGSPGEPAAVAARFGTFPGDLERLRNWVVEQQVTDVVMESTSVYWMRVYELLEPVTKPAVVNASHVKKVPGRKTDMSDAEWLADLHAHGLLRLSFVPPKPIRELRALTRYRTKLVASRTATCNRTIKLLEMAGIKLSSVVTDCFGATGRGLLDALCKGPLTEATVQQAARGTLREKVPLLMAALATPLDAVGRQVLQMHLRAYDAADALIAETDAELNKRGKPYATVIDKLDAVPGINPLAAITLLSEIGTDMSPFQNAAHLTALAGLAPGNKISDQKRRPISVRKGNRHLKRICVQIAWAITRKKDSFLCSRFIRLSRRIGRNKAIVATARQVLIIVYHLLSSDEPYRDRGSNYYDQDKQRQVRREVRKLEKLGFKVDLKPLVA